MSVKRGRPFFYEPSTQRWIERLSREEDLGIYAGAGVTIDRTGLAWTRLADELLAETFDLGLLTDDVKSAFGVQRKASIAFQRLSAIHGDNTPTRVAEVLRRILYADSSWVSGMLAAQLATLARSRADSGKKTEILTTNYDDYIERPLVGSEMNVVVSGKPVRRGRKTAPISLRYLHGRIPEHEAPTEVVISEADYSESDERVYGELMEALQRGTFLILGSSLTDTALVRALIDSKEAARKAGRKRLVVISRQGNTVAADPVGRQLLRSALEHFGCTAVYPDFHCQIAQFVCEIRVCSRNPEEYVRRVSTQNYRGRLGGWWDGWMQEMQDDLASQQALHHQRLRAVLDTVRDALDAPEDESLKLELWMRWRPDDRRLKLWASSVGTWTDEMSMRSGRIASDSEYVSVRAFCDGHPILKSFDAEAHERWKTYLAAPVWVTTDDASHIAGVVTLASMAPEKSSSVSLHNRAKLRRALAHIDRNATQLLTPATARILAAADA